MEGNGASFYGNLDIKTLGGAGFASQFSPLYTDREEDASDFQDVRDKNTDDVAWDLSAYDGIEVNYNKSDGKVYTLILRDDRSSGKRDDGREQAGINWEVDLRTKAEGGKTWRPWKDFKATYRGKEKEDTGNLRTGQIYRVGIMMRR